MDKIIIFNSTEYILGENRARLERANLIYLIAEEEGFNVEFVSSKFNHFTKSYREKNLNGAVTLWTTPYKQNMSILRLLNHLILGLNFFVYLFRNRQEIKLVFISFPPIETAFFGSLFCKIFRKKIIIDVRDRWPELIAENSNSKVIKLLTWLYKKPRDFALRNCSKIMATSPEFLENIVEISKIDLSKVDGISVNMSYLDSCGGQKIKKVSKGPVKVCFSGSFVLQDAVALKEFIEIFLTFPQIDVELVLCGDGPLKKYLEKLSESDARVKFMGFLDKETLSEVLQTCHYGLLPYKPESHFEFSYPNKFGEYLSFGLPVLTSLTKGAVANFIKASGVGLSYNHESKETIFNLLSKISIEQSFALESVCRSNFNSHFNAAQNYRSFVQENFK